MMEYEAGFLAGQDFVLRYILAMKDEIGESEIKKIMEDFGYVLRDGKYVNE